MSNFRISFILLLAAATLAAQPHPNFSGTWNLNLAASDFSDARANKPDRLTIAIQQKNQELKYRLDREKDGKKGGFNVDLSIGGAAFESDAAGVITAEWKSDKLEVKTLYNPGQDRQSDVVETWWLSADGKQLLDDYIYHLPDNGGAVHIRRVFDKKN